MNNIDLIYSRKIGFYNIVIVSIFICLSMTSHLIAYRLTVFNDYVIIPSSFTYMACFVIIDILSCFNKKILVFTIIVLEAVTNLIMIIITNAVISMPYPDIFKDHESYSNVFYPITSLYIANILGSFIAFTFNASLFSFLHKKKNFSFMYSSLISFFVIVIIYTAITDYLAFYYLYPDLTKNLTITNMVTNFISIIIYSIVSKYIIRYINSKLN